MQINKSLAYFLKYLVLLIATTAVLVLFMLVLREQPVLAQDATDPDNSENQDENNEEKENEDSKDEAVTIADDVTFEQDESTEGKLIFKFNTIKDHEGYSLQVDADDGNKINWQYAGPSTDSRESGQCDELNVGDLAGKMQTVEATLIEDDSSSDENKTKAYVTINLRSDARNDTQYCFVVPLVKDVEAGEEAETKEIPRLVVLEEQVKEDSNTDGSFIEFTTSSPASDKPSQFTLTASIKESASIKIDESSWQNIVVADLSDCSAEGAKNLTFEAAAAENNMVELDAEDVEKTFCFRVANADDPEDFVYNSYTVPSVPADPVDDEAGVNIVIVVAIVALILVLGGGLIFFITKKNKSAA